MTLLTFQQAQKIAKLVEDYQAHRLTTENRNNDELVICLREEDKTVFRRIVLNEKGQVTLIQVA